MKIEDIPSEEPSPLEVLQRVENGAGAIEATSDLLRSFLEFVATGPATRRALRVRCWVALDVVCPTQNPVDVQSVSAAANTYGVSRATIYKLRAQAKSHFLT